VEFSSAFEYTDKLYNLGCLYDSMVSYVIYNKPRSFKIWKKPNCERYRQHSEYAKRMMEKITEEVQTLKKIAEEIRTLKAEMQTLKNNQVREP
jgi:hypothetical protein